MEFRQMRYFLAVAEALHFRHASEALHLSQPTLSMQIQNLEEELGVELFKRTSRRVELTRAGETLLSRCRSLISGIDDAVSVTQRVAQGLEGRLAITYVSTAAVGILPHAIKRLKDETPGIDFELDACHPQEQIDRILQKRADIGFLHAALEHHQLNTKVVQRDELVVALPLSVHLDGPVNLADLKHFSFFMPRPWGTASSSFYSHVKNAFQLAGIDPEHVIHTSLANSLRFVAAGIGIALVPASFQSSDTHGVLFRPLLAPPPPIELIAVWHRAAKSSLLERFVQILDSPSLV